ncbi:MAG: TetR/AcrR family transcriptional regulator [Bilophila wadsworthia]
MAAFHRGNTGIGSSDSEKGIAGTTMDDIAKAAEYRKTTIYNYFRSKEELVNHLFFEGIEFSTTS